MPNTLDLWPAAAVPLWERVQPAAGLDACSRAQRAGGSARGAGVPQPGHFRPSTSGRLRAPGLRAARRRQAERAGRVPAGRGRVADIRCRKEPTNLRGRQVEKGDCAKRWGKEKLDEAEGGGLVKTRRSRAIASTKGTTGWAGKRTKSGVSRAGPGQHIPHVADGVSVGKIKSGDTTCP